MTRRPGGRGRGPGGGAQTARCGQCPGSGRLRAHRPEEAVFQPSFRAEPRAGSSVSLSFFPSFLGVGTSALLRSHGWSFLCVSGPLDFLHPTLCTQPGQLASPRRGPRDTLVIWEDGQDAGSTRSGRQLAWRLGARALGGGLGLCPGLLSPTQVVSGPSVKWGQGSCLPPAPGAASGPSGVERVHSEPSTRQCPPGPRKESVLHPLLLSPPGSWPVGPSFAWPRTWKLEMAEFFAGPLGLACVRG